MRGIRTLDSLSTSRYTPHSLSTLICTQISTPNYGCKNRFQLSRNQDNLADFRPNLEQTKLTPKSDRQAADPIGIG